MSCNCCRCERERAALADVRAILVAKPYELTPAALKRVLEEERGLREAAERELDRWRRAAVCSTPEELAQAVAMDRVFKTVVVIALMVAVGVALLPVAMS